MLFKSTKKPTPIEWVPFLGTTLVFLFSLHYFRANLQPKEIATLLPPPEKTLLTVPSNQGTRTLASANSGRQSSQAKENREDKFLRALAMPCTFNGSQEEKLQVDTPFLRLNFYDCPKEMAQGAFSVRLRNLATGENILLIPDEFGKKITTNYFPLEPGSNHFKLEFQTKKKIISKLITALRQAN